MDRIINLRRFYPSWNNGLPSSLSSDIRPDFEVVKEGRILKKIKNYREEL